MYIEPIKPHSLNIRDACAYTGLSRSRLYQLIKDGRIKSYTVGARRMFRREDLDAFLNEAALNASGGGQTQAVA